MTQLVETVRERIDGWGTSPCTDAELLAIVLGGKNADRASDLLTDGISALLTKPLPGVGPVQLARVRAAIELGRRSLLPTVSRPSLSSAHDIAASLIPKHGAGRVETFGVLLLDTKNRGIRNVILSTGTLDQTTVHPREVFAAAIEFRSSSIVCWHNHPSGDPTPSVDDVAITKQLHEAGKIVGIELLDHVIITATSYYSMREGGQLA